MRSKPLRSSDWLRILFLGNSIIHGGVETDHSELASSKLEDTLTKETGKSIRILNISAGGWGPDHEAEYLNVWGDFDAKYIVLVTNSNNAVSTISQDARIGLTPYTPVCKPPSALYELLERYASRWLQQQLVNLFSHASPRPTFDGQTPPSVPGGFALIPPARLNPGFDSIWARAQRKHLPLLVVLHPMTQEMAMNRYDANGEAIFNFFKVRGVPIIRELDNHPSIGMYRDNIHYNAKGQAFLYSEIYPVLHDFLAEKSLSQSIMPTLVPVAAARPDMLRNPPASIGRKTAQ
jgi:lysophospholipase L1-like esterase